MCVPYTRVNFDKWRILSTLDKNVWQDSELVHAISGDAALLVKHGKLYFVGTWVGTEGRYATSSPKHIEELDSHTVCCIASSTNHAVLLSNKGFVSTIEICNGTYRPGALSRKRIKHGEILVAFPVIPAIIVDVCCGHRFALALDNFGTVWCWGSFYGHSSHVPTRLSGTNFIKIAAGAGDGALLDQSGKIYYWKTERQLIDFPDVAQQIVCCFEDLYILTKEYNLFKYSNELEKIDLNCQINYIASNSNIIVARSTNGVFFILNDKDGSFQQVKSANILECFVNSKMPGVVSYTSKEIEPSSGSEETNILLESIAQLYNSQNFSDVDIILSDGAIHAHKCILAARSKLFNRLLTSPESNELNFSNASPNVLKSYVNYIYSGCLPELDKFDLLLELYEMAKEDTNKLSDYCIKQGRSLINEENALANYVASARFNNTVLMRDCAEVVVKNCEKNVVTELFKSLKIDEVHKLFEYGTKSHQ